MDDKTKWIRLIQWKFGGCRPCKSLSVPGEIDEGYVRLLSGNIEINNRKENTGKLIVG